MIKCFPKSLPGDTSPFPLNGEAAGSAWVPACTWIELAALNSFLLGIALKYGWTDFFFFF